MNGLKAAGFTSSRNELVALNGFFELVGYWWPTVKDTISPNSLVFKKQSCSSFITTGSMTSDGGIVLGHNSMFGYYFPLPNIILDILPEKGHRILWYSGICEDASCNSICILHRRMV